MQEVKTSRRSFASVTMLLSKLLCLRQSVLLPGCCCDELSTRDQAQGFNEILSDLACAGKAPPEGLVDGKAPLVL